MDSVTERLLSAADDLGISRTDIQILAERDIPARERRAPFVAVFFGYLGATDDAHPALASVVADSLPIIPVVDSLDGFRGKVPPSLEGVNGLAVPSSVEIPRLVSAINENLKLLRAERRLFISYRRVESRGVAIQLYEALDSRGFDVFLDTHGVPPGVDVQSELWHRLADSDVIVLLDTPGFRSSRWTVEELARANATSVQILHLLWPDVDPDPGSAFSAFFPIAADNFLDGAGRSPGSILDDATVREVCASAESLRARALAARYAYIVDSFCDLARANGRRVDVHPQRYLSLASPGGPIAIFPAVGVPSAPRLEQFEQALHSLGKTEEIKVIYDERGILARWCGHLDWLSTHLPVKAVRMNALPEAFASGAL